MPLIERTLFQVNLQTAWVHLIAFDFGSSDGTRKLLEQTAADVIEMPKIGYLPGCLLNEGMRRAMSDVVVFLNTDCVPTDELWLERLLMPFSDPKVAAAYGRLLQRPGSPAHQWVRKNCFSLANAAVRRSVWQEMPFDETLGSSEDVAWSVCVRNAGYAIRYAPTAAVYQWQRSSGRELQLAPHQLVAGSMPEQKEITTPAALRPTLPRP